MKTEMMRETLKQCELSMVNANSGIELYDAAKILALRDELKESIRLMELLSAEETKLEPIVTTERTYDEMSPPSLLVLPSGRPFRLDLVFDIEDRDGLSWVQFFSPAGESYVIGYPSTDAAAIKSAILRYGVEANAATQKGEDL